MRLLLAVLAIPLIEIGLFIVVGGAIGLWPTLALVVLAAVAGVALIRTQGARTQAGMRAALEGLRHPAEPVAESAMTLVAGLLLIAPGFLSDALALLLLLPPVRAMVVRSLSPQVRFAAGPPRRDIWPDPETGQGDVIDGEYLEIDPENRPRRDPSGWTRH